MGYAASGSIRPWSRVRVDIPCLSKEVGGKVHDVVQIPGNLRWEALVEPYVLESGLRRVHPRSLAESTFDRHNVRMASLVPCGRAALDGEAMEKPTVISVRVELVPYPLSSRGSCGARALWAWVGFYVAVG